MTTNDDQRSPDAQQADALDELLDLLDGRANGERSPRNAIAPALAETARQLQALADATVASQIEPGSEARTWEALMRGRPAEPQRVTRPSAVHLFPSQKVIPILPSRLRRLGSQSLGLVATMTLIAMIGLSGLAVYLSAPQRDDPATVAGIAGASPVATITTTDSQEIFYGPCDVTPRDYEELMDTVSTQLLVPEPVVPYSRARTVSTDMWGPRYQLPEGAPVSTETQVEVVDQLGVWMNCTPFLRTALSTDDYLLRLALDGPFTGWTTFSWWLYSHPELAPPPSERRDAETGVVIDPDASDLAMVGASPFVYAYGFRVLDDRHIAAYLASPIVQTTNQGIVPSYTPLSDPQYEERGYVVLSHDPDGQWLIDDFALNRRASGTP